jgi:hypothetical protein
MAQEFVARKGLLVPSGNVGIGTTSPSAKLQVVGGSRMASTGGITTPLLNLMQSNDVNGYYFSIDNALDGRMELRNDAGTTIQTWQRSTGNVGIGTTSPTQKLSIGGVGSAISFDTTGASGTSLIQTVLDFELSIKNNRGTSSEIRVGNEVLNFLTNSTERMRITSGGNVGIGTTSPSERLEVSNTYRDNTSGLFTAVVSSTTSQATGYGGSIGFQGVYTGTSLTSFGSIMGAKENSIDGNTAGYLALFTRTNAGANTERMRINSAGNVLINITSTIDSKLVVASSTSTSASYSAIFASSSGSDILDIRGDGLITMPFLISVFTTGNAANVWTNPSNGDLYRSTSSIKYKKNVENYTKGLTELMQLRPVSYEGKSEVDAGKTFAGLIAEEVHELGLTEYVQYSDDGSPNALSYQNMVAILIKSVQELKNELETLKNK